MFTYIQPCTTDWLVFDKQWRKQAIPLAPIFFSRSLSLSQKSENKNKSSLGEEGCENSRMIITGYF